MQISQARGAARSAAKFALAPVMRGTAWSSSRPATRWSAAGPAGHSLVRGCRGRPADPAVGELPQARVATVITTYRRPEIVQRAIQSALAQTVRDQVIMVVDDAGGLPDLPQDPRVSGVSLSANVAIAGVVRNMGARLTRSEYVAFLDDDNEWEPNHLETALAALDDDHDGALPTWSIPRCAGRSPMGA